jgi:hypothetical protein
MPHSWGICSALRVIEDTETYTETYTYTNTEIWAFEGLHPFPLTLSIDKFIDANFRCIQIGVLDSHRDRLSPNLAFISGLVAQRVKFVFTELGAEADPFMLHIYAAI